MATFPKLGRGDIRTIAERIVHSTDHYFKGRGQQPIVRIVADHPQNFRRLQSALRKKWRANVVFCRVAPDSALTVAATFDVQLLSCAHCHTPYEEGRVALALEGKGRSVPLKETEAQVFICPHCGVEDAPVPQEQPEERDILDEPWNPEPAILVAPVSIVGFTEAPGVGHQEPVAHEVVPTVRNADSVRNTEMSGLTNAEYRSPRTHVHKAAKPRSRPASCPGSVIDAEGNSHPCRHTLTEARIATGSTRGGNIRDRAKETGGRQSRLAKQVHIDGLVEAPKSKSFITDPAIQERVNRLNAQVEALRSKQLELGKKQDELRALRRTQQTLVMTGHETAAKHLESKRVIPLIQALTELERSGKLL